MAAPSSACRKKALKLEESQAAAAAGQIALAKAYADVLGGHSIRSGQILVTLSDTEERRRYLNARATIETLLKLKAVPVINENDTVATTEIRYGDNDRLAARVATMMMGRTFWFCSPTLTDFIRPRRTRTRTRSFCRWSKPSRRRSKPWRERRLPNCRAAA